MSSQTNRSAPLASYSVGSYPYNDVALIEDNLFPGGERGSGVVIGPHTVLTASHLLWDNTTMTSASQVSTYLGYSNASQDPGLNGATAVAGTWRTHYFKIDDTNDLITQQQSQFDYAVIDYSTSFSSWFGQDPNFQSGAVHATGYPVNPAGTTSATSAQYDFTGNVSTDSAYTVLDYNGLTVYPGNSGGPLWVDKGTASNPLPYVVGLVSTGGWAFKMTGSALSQIQSWIASDASLWSGTSPPPPPPPPPPVGVDSLDFDRSYYLAQNADVAAAGVDPRAHYLVNGWREGRNPDALFNTAFYLARNPDVAAAGINPLVHFAITGWREGRDPSASFSVAAYERLNPDVAAAHIDPLNHYLNTGKSEGRRIS